ncbi:diguanylate cyclase (GGDEF)-like protein [Luteimonas cucumeris]|uniref:diguanylate cyclase n=1 Tax=Luteimonas cucumeris TaxID=985012 RepID=A0A562L4T7_9GAMM|nr:GGDEF domain-containing protein [Luteimonas cucumeris]TWI02697.1 diguanylate cyclase (GGDEF)-like protein [Luteimonas cucumeris]
MTATRPLNHEWLFAIGLVLLAAVSAASVAAASFSAEQDIAVRVSPAPGAHAAQVTTAGDGIVMSGGHSVLSKARMEFELPPADAEGQRWVVLFHRVMVEEIDIGNAQWHSPTRRFFAPHADEGAIPSVFVFTLPQHWQDAIALDLRVRSGTGGVLRPLVMRESTAIRIEQRIIALAAAVYASLFMLALMMLALFHAAHDRAFLAYFGFALSALLMVAALNGHLYLLPGFRLLAPWRELGAVALTMLFSAAALQILMRYADLRGSSPRAAALGRIACTVLLAIAALALLGLETLRAPLQAASLSGWLAVSFGCIAVAFDAVRRRVAMARPIALLCVLTGIAAVVAELLSQGYVGDFWWTRRGYQVVLVACAAALAIGLAARVSDYRSQRDRARLAHEDSDRRASREAARLALAEGLQARLKLLAAGDLEWTAYRRVLDQLRRMLDLDAAAAAIFGSDSETLLVAEPNERKPQYAQLVARRQNMLKSLARTRAPMQVTLDEPDAPPTGKPVPAIVPLPLHAPAWGVMILERGRGDGFTTDELALASEFGRLAVQAIDEANTSIRLRRSAEMDALTGALNRRTLDQWLSRSFSEAHRYNKELSVLFVDLDNFKAINDTYGHAAGDHCLRRVSGALRGVIGLHDLLGRYGGEEFLVASVDATSDAARQLGERIRAAVENLPVEWSGQTLKLTASVGVASRWPHEHEPNETIERADKALYAAKRTGRNRVSVAPAVFI